MRSSTLGITLEVAEPSSSCKYYPPTTTQLDLYTNLYQNIITDFSNKWRALLLPYTQYPKDHDFVAGIAGLVEGLSLPALEELRLCAGANSSSQNLGFLQCSHGSLAVATPAFPAAASQPAPAALEVFSVVTLLSLHLTLRWLAPWSWHRLQNLNVDVGLTCSPITVIVLREVVALPKLSAVRGYSHGYD
ncbi:hypothetical protein BT96DRAFT_1027166 [Gymnopus androsaceus JB14]|uniref:Uncharacterized protein n=1 Tax=Gymnopus androsaceus JB14 TaxID=1447944 RepID=A0A6A4GDL8_9AGAR|nr:hypothetical protein BT96DRAFT_1027166 [Gymnopus androsaceus JB14]